MIILPWIRAFRLRTLPLALSTIFMGAALAHFFGFVNWPVFFLALVTTLFLQILSNLANDYGDSSHGVDHSGRLGPIRTVQAGLISGRQMKVAVAFFAGLSLLSGLSLVWLALGEQAGWKAMVLIFFGILSIVAALKYTMGKNPYGYSGFGDIAVFLFFGVVGVVGTFFLLAGEINFLVFLPAFSMGLLSTGVLNLNNLRDRESDQQSGKISLVVRMGMKNAKWYHFFLILFSFVFSLIFVLVSFRFVWQLAFLLLLPFFIWHVHRVFITLQPKDFDPKLRHLALLTLLFSLLFGLPLIWG